MLASQGGYDEFEQFLRCSVIGNAKLVVQFVVIGVLAPEDRHRDACLLQRGTKQGGLRRRIDVIGNVQDEERRNAFAGLDVSDGGEVDMLLRSAELFPMAIR